MTDSIVLITALLLRRDHDQGNCLKKCIICGSYLVLGFQSIIIMAENMTGGRHDVRDFTERGFLIWKKKRRGWA